MRVLFFIFCLNFYATLSAQKPEAAIQTLYQKYPQEKVLLSFSKNEYIAGETIYFKAYVLMAYELSDISGNLYTELYDKNKVLIDKQILPVYKGAGQGSIALAPSLAEEVYYIRAYTQWMLNFDERFQYVQPIAVYNPYSAKRLQPKAVQWKAAAFIEGDKLLSDVPAKLAVRLTTQGSLPASWKGSLLEGSSNTSIADVQVFNNEIGEVTFTPEANTSYRIKVKDDASKEQEIALPQVQTTGVSIALKVKNDKVDYAVQTKDIPLNGAGYKVVGTIHDQLVFLATIKKSDGYVTGSIDTKALPSGVMQITLFNEKEEPVLQRLCFVHLLPLKTVTPKLETDTLSFADKGFNNWQLTQDSVTWYSWSMQVTDAAFPVTNHFLSDIYLTSDFATPIHNAADYFINPDDKKAAALDALLLTEKWERFNWEAIINNRFPVIKHNPDNLLSYTAIVSKGKKLQPLKEVNLIFQTKDSAMQIVNVKTDSAGKFYLTNIDLTDTATVFFMPNKKKIFERDIAIDFVLQNRFYPFQMPLPASGFETVTRTQADTLPLQVKQSMDDRNTELLLAEKSKMMQEVIVSTKARNATEELDKKLSSGLFSSADAIVYDFVNDEQTSAMAYTNILQWLQGRVPGLSLTNRDGALVPVIRGSVASLFLDEIRIEPDQLNGFPVSDIAMVKVIRGYSVMGGSGSIAIYTRRGDERSKFASAGLPHNLLIGYRPVLPFFLPDYAEGIGSNVNDKRTILFRSSLLYPKDVSLQVPVLFFNNSGAKRFHITVTGFAEDGSPVYLQKEITRSGNN